jgi:hypothetical protein
MNMVEEWMYSNTFIVDLEETFARWRLLETSLPVRAFNDIWSHFGSTICIIRCSSMESTLEDLSYCSTRAICCWHALVEPLLTLFDFFRL